VSRVLSSGDAPRASLTLKILATIAVVMLLKLANEVLLPIAIAIILTFLLAPLVRSLRARGIDDAIGAAVVVFGLLALVILLTSRLVQPATEWVARAPTTLQQAIDAFDRMRDSVPFLSAPHAAASPRGRPVAPPQPPPADPVKEKIATESVAITGTLLKQLAGMAVSTIATVMLLYFFLASERWLIARTVEAMPQRRARVAVIGGVRAAQRDIATFLGTQAIINVGVAVATSAWFLASADERDAYAVVDLLAASASARLALEQKQGPGVVAAATDRVKAEETEKAVLSAWRKWYSEALDSVRHLPVKGTTPSLDAKITQAQERLKP